MTFYKNLIPLVSVIIASLFGSADAGEVRDFRQAAIFGGG
jgi:phage terminase large subunit-like protein